uniref:Uncharacterized protein n=1 Tax=Tanacetum cinerariifolium TaxID=118510 RepID=A0A699K6K4_TANCI|nr:hypothetical protein [Tanacetum cinerariifolium]
MAEASIGNHEKQVVTKFSGNKRGATVELEDEDIEGDKMEHSDDEVDENVSDDMDEEEKDCYSYLWYAHAKCEGEQMKGM